MFDYLLIVIVNFRYKTFAMRS